LIHPSPSNSCRPFLCQLARAALCSNLQRFQSDFRARPEVMQRFAA